MNRVLIALMALLLLDSAPLPKSGHESSSAAADSTKTTSHHAPRRKFKEAPPLPEADTSIQFQYSFVFSRRNSELWVTDTVSHVDRQLTFTLGKIDSYLVSPTRRYVVCAHRISWVPSPGIFEREEDRSEEPVHSLLVVRTVDGKSIRDIPPPLDLFFDFDRWISNSRLLCVTSDGFAVGSVFVYDAVRDSLQRVPYDFVK